MNKRVGRARNHRLLQNKVWRALEHSGKEGAPQPPQREGAASRQHRNSGGRTEGSSQTWAPPLAQLKVWGVTSGKPNMWLMELNLSDLSLLGRTPPTAAELRDEGRV